MIETERVGFLLAVKLVVADITTIFSGAYDSCCVVEEQRDGLAGLNSHPDGFLASATRSTRSTPSLSQSREEFQYEQSYTHSIEYSRQRTCVTS